MFQPTSCYRYPLSLLLRACIRFWRRNCGVSNLQGVRPSVSTPRKESEPRSERPRLVDTRLHIRDPSRDSERERERKACCNSDDPPINEPATRRALSRRHGPPSISADAPPPSSSSSCCGRSKPRLVLGAVAILFSRGEGFFPPTPSASSYHRHQDHYYNSQSSSDPQPPSFLPLRQGPLLLRVSYS